MQDEQSRAERKAYLRSILEPRLRQAVDEMSAVLLAEEHYIDKGTMVQIILGKFSESIIAEVAKDGLNETVREREDIALFIEIAGELCDTIKQGAMH